MHVGKYFLVRWARFPSQFVLRVTRPPILARCLQQYLVTSPIPGPYQNGGLKRGGDSNIAYLRFNRRRRSERRGAPSPPPPISSHSRDVNKKIAKGIFHVMACYSFLEWESVPPPPPAQTQTMQRRGLQTLGFGGSPHSLCNKRVVECVACKSSLHTQHVWKHISAIQ